MADGSPDDLEEQADEGRADEGRILSPEELDISKSEHVEQLDEGRFVVSPDGAPDIGPNDRSESAQTDTSSGPTESQREDDPDDFTQQSETQRTPQTDQTDGQTRSAGGSQPPRGQQPVGGEQANRQGQPHQGELTEEVVHRWLRQNFQQRNSTYAFDITATFEGQVSQRQMASNDVVTVFESLLLWYAQQVDSNTPVEEILGILLTEANVPIQYPSKSIHSLVKTAGLSPDDSIADLLEAVDNGAKL